jgi:hypothetical protein
MTIARVLSILMGFVVTASFIYTIRTFRKERALRWWAPAVSTVLASVAVPISLFVAGIPQAWAVGFGLGAAGFLVGVLWGFTIKIHWREGVPVGRNSVLWLVFFFVSFMFTYTLMLFAPTTLITLGALASAFPTGMGVGTNANLLARLALRAGESKAALQGAGT